MKKEYGFTLAELLAVIVILGVITAITVPVVTTQIDNYKTKLCVTQYDNILNAARAYGADHLNELDADKTITLSDLNSGGYIDAEDLEDPVTKENINLDLKIKIVKIGKKYNYYLDENSTIGCKDDFDGFYDSNKLYTGIKYKDYTTGDKLSYLGYNWLVMKDNGSSTQLVLDGHLSVDDLKNNLPGDVASSKVNSSGGMSMCDSSSNTYCNFNDINYSWKKSLVMPTIENWLDNKMTENGLAKTKELVGMSFSDGTETINSYVRIPMKEEVVAIETACADGTLGNPYCADDSHYMFASYNYWVMTKYYNDNACYAFQYYNDPKYGIGGELFIANNVLHKVRPIITVREK